MSTFNKGIYEAVLRFLAVLSSLVMMYISAQFSVDGFSFQSPDKQVIGWMLAIILIIVEMIFNNSVSSVEDTDDPLERRRIIILFVAGLVAYVYGIATNISGILHSGQLPNSPFDYVVPIALGLFLEIVPEPLMVWALVSQKKPSGNKGQQPTHYKHFDPQQKNTVSRFMDTELVKRLPRKHG